MATFDQTRAIARYAELSRLISVGAYEERGLDGSFSDDGIEKGVFELEREAMHQGLEFIWHKSEQRYTLEPMDALKHATFSAIEDIDQRVAALAPDMRYPGAYGVLRGYVASLLKILNLSEDQRENIQSVLYVLDQATGESEQS